MARTRKNPLEWMPLYFRDLRTSETWRLMSHAQRGLYLELMGHQWEEESIPGDPALVAQLIHPAPEAADLERVLEQFPTENDGRRRNKRTADVRKTAMSQYRKQVKQAQTMRSVRSGSGLDQGLTQGIGQGVGEGIGASTSTSQSVGAVLEGIGKGNQLPAEVEAAAAVYLRPARFPAAIRATLANLLNPEASPHYPAPAVVTALTEMQAAGRPFNASTLTAWLSRSRASAPTTTGGMMAKMRRAS